MLTSMAAARLAANDNDGDKVTPIDSKGDRTPADNDATIRDSLSAIVGKGYTGINDDIKGRVRILQGILGAPTAQKLINHALLFNQRLDMQDKGAEDRVRSFYDMQHADEEVNGLVKRLKAFGSGPVAGLNDSPDVTNRDLSGRKEKLPLLNSGIAGGMMGIPLR